LNWCWYKKVDCKCPGESDKRLVDWAKTRYPASMYEYGPGNGSANNYEGVKDGVETDKNGNPILVNGKPIPLYDSRRESKGWGQVLLLE